MNQSLTDCIMSISETARRGFLYYIGFLLLEFKEIEANIKFASISLKHMHIYAILGLKEGVSWKIEMRWKVNIKGF